MTGPVLDAGALRRLRADLDRAGYTERGVREALGAPGGVAFLRRELAVSRRRLPDGEAISTLVRLFLLHDPVPEAEASRVVDVDALRRIGFLDGHDPLRSSMHLSPFGELVLAGERDDPATMRPDHVPSIHLASRSLARLTVRRHVRTAFDMGTGCGIHALLAAAHSDAVVASDVNPRALAFARLNAALNGIDGIELREGSWFEPVGGERFDLVVANPPFILGPSSDYVYRDAGDTGDEISRNAVRGAAGALAPGGYASVLCNWVVADEASWWNEPTEWLRDIACDAWILSTGVLDALAYAAAMNVLQADHDPDGYERTLDRWRRHFERRNIRRVGLGAVVLRRRRDDRPGWTRAATLHDDPGDAAGAQLPRMFDGVDAVASLDDRALLALRPALRDGHRIDEVFSRDDGAYAAESARIVEPGGIGLHVLVDPRALAVLFACDGARTLGDLAVDVAARVGASRAEMTRVALDAVRGLADAGLLAPSSP